MTPTPEPVREAARRLRSGDFVLVYDADDREAETDLLVAADSVQPHHVRTMRNQGGGVIFAAVDPRIAEALSLPFLRDALEAASAEHEVAGDLLASDLPYDARSSFSIPVNHRDTFTGITDEDRALTLRQLADLDAARARVDDEALRERFTGEFRAPGHVPLCVGARGLLDERQGHTELALALARVADLPGVVAGTEMLAEGGALPLDEAREWARERDTVHLAGEAVRDAWRKHKASTRDVPVEA